MQMRGMTEAARRQAAGGGESTPPRARSVVALGCSIAALSSVVALLGGGRRGGAARLVAMRLFDSRMRIPIRSQLKALERADGFAVMDAAEGDEV